MILPPAGDIALVVLGALLGGALMLKLRLWRSLLADSASTTAVCTPRLRAADAGMQPRPLIDGFTPNYLLRVLGRFPRQGDRAPGRISNAGAAGTRTSRGYFSSGWGWRFWPC